jgi:hypothetical protein
VSHTLHVYRTDEVLFELLRRGRVDWQDVLIAGGIDPLEVEHRAFLELQLDNGCVVVLTEPLA